MLSELSQSEANSEMISDKKSDDGNMWLYNFYQFDGPSYEKNMDYVYRCDVLMKSKQLFEKLLMDHVFANICLKDEYKNQNEKYQRNLKDQRNSDDCYGDVGLDKKICYVAKKARRKTDYILKQYCCGWDKCEKIYGTKDALNQHIKRKHK